MIILASEYKYPDGDAGSVRFHNFALTLKQLGYQPFIIGNGAITNNVGYNEGIPFLSLRKANRNIGYLTFSVRLIKHIEDLRKSFSIESIIIGHPRLDLLILLKTYCNYHNIKLIIDVVEWFSPFQFKHGKYSWTYIENNLVNNYILRKNDNVIAISSFLANHFKKKHLVVEQIPIYLDQKSYNPKTKEFEKIIITYAGQPGHKDFLWLMLMAFSKLADSTNLKNYEFHILGCNNSQILNICKECNIDYKKLKEILVAEGRVSKQRVREVLENTHFTILFRDNTKRYAKAGFPTKVIESISYGIPPILNISSDLGMHLKDDQNAIIANDISIDEVTKAIRKAINISIDDYSILASNAKATAYAHFDLNSYSEQLKHIIE